MDGEFPWIYVAMMVVAFISWVFNRIQEATAARKRNKETQRRRTESPIPERRASAGPPPLPRDRDIDSEPTVEAPVVGERLRELMEALGAPPPQTAPEPIERTLPERAPKKTPEPAAKPSQPKAPILSAQERAALDRVKKREADPAYDTRKQDDTGVAVAEIRKLVSSPGGLRKAVILREILDPPLALREERPQ